MTLDHAGRLQLACGHTAEPKPYPVRAITCSECGVTRDVVTDKPTRADIAEYRVGRNFIRVGDTVRCKPLAGSSFKARVTRITRIGDDDSTIEVSVFGGSKGRGAHRTFSAERITRLAQTRAGEEREF